MKRIFYSLTAVMAALLVTACTKCTNDKPVEPPPPVVEPAPVTPPTDSAMPGDVSADPVDEAAPAK